MEDRQQHQTKQSWLRRHLPAIMLLLFVVQPVMDVLSFGLTQCGVSNTVSAMPALFGAVWDRRSGICPEQAQKSVFDFGRYRADICRAAWLGLFVRRI